MRIQTVARPFAILASFSLSRDRSRRKSKDVSKSVALLKKRFMAFRIFDLPTSLPPTKILISFVGESDKVYSERK
jgi:hypothetical protein